MRSGAGRPSLRDWASPTKLVEHHLPPADGTHRGQSWWLPETLHAWAGQVFAGELLEMADIRAQLDCSDDEWDQLRDTLPDPALTDPDRWWPRQVSAWIRERWRRAARRPRRPVRP